MITSDIVSDYAYVPNRTKKVLNLPAFMLGSTAFGEYSRQGGVMMYAIIQTGGKQYRVTEGDVLNIEKLEAAEGEVVAFDRVLTVVSNGDVKIGTPVVAGAKVTAKVVAHGKDKKILVFKYKAKSNYRRRQGHRQPFTKVEISKIEA